MTHRSWIGAAGAFIIYEVALLSAALVVGRIYPPLAGPILFMAQPWGADTAYVLATGALLTSQWGHGSQPTVVRSAIGGPGLPSSNYALSYS